LEKGDTKVMYDISMSQAELDFCLRAEGSVSSAQPTNLSLSVDTDMTFQFHGERTRTKFLFSLKMYAEEVREWIDKEEQKKLQIQQQQIDSLSLTNHRPNRRTYSCSY
jgi:hypothetical protein